MRANSRFSIRSFSLIAVLAVSMGAGVPHTTVAIPHTPLNKVFVGDYNSRTVTVLDTTDDHILAQGIPWSVRPEIGAITPDGSRLFLAGVGDNLQSMDTTTYAVIDTISLNGNDERGLVITPDTQRLYLSDNGSRKVSIVDLTTDQVLGRVPLPPAYRGHPEQIALSPDGSRLFLAQNGPDAVIAVDTGTNRPVGHFLYGNHPAGVSVSPDGQRVYAAYSTSGTVSVADAHTLALIGTVDSLHGGYLVLSHDGYTLYSINYTGSSVSVINTTTLELTTTIPIPNTANRGALSEDGTKLYVGTTNGTLVVIATATNAIIENIPLGGNLDAVVTYSPGN